MVRSESVFDHIGVEFQIQKWPIFIIFIDFTAIEYRHVVHVFESIFHLESNGGIRFDFRSCARSPCARAFGVCAHSVRAQSVCARSLCARGPCARA